MSGRTVKKLRREIKSIVNVGASEAMSELARKITIWRVAAIVGWAGFAGLVSWGLLR